MLPLNLPGVIVERTEDTGTAFSVYANCEGRPAGCTTCGSPMLYAHGTLKQDIMDLPLHGKVLCIHLTRKRWKCRDCNTTFLHPLNWIDDDHRATIRFINKIASLSLERSFSDLAREYGVHEKTVRNIFYRHYRDVIDTTRFQSPKYMGIDEIKIAGGLRGVITNISDRTGIEFLAKNTTVALSAYFEKMPDRENVKAVAIDCTRHYRTLIYQYFPNASVVADKYHILRSADFAVDKIRIDVRNSIENKRTKLKLKKDKFILKTREKNLTDWDREQLKTWRESFPILGTTYDLKEEFYRIYDARNVEEARLKFTVWKGKIPESLLKYWEPILTTWTNWDKEIFEYWNHPITNAYTECQNMLTRAIDRLGRGYSFDALRVKLLLAPKRQGVITSFRSIKRKKTTKNLAMPSYSLARAGIPVDDYEICNVEEQKMVELGIDLTKLADWLESQEQPPH